MTTSITDTDMGMQAVIDAVQEQGGFVDIGIQSDEEDSLLQKATDNEFGKGRTPARPFIRGAIDKNEDEFLRHAEKVSGEIVDGKMSKYDALTEMGMLIEDGTKLYVKNLDTPPNAPLTIKLKGFDNPLIHTGEMLNSIRYAVKPGKSDG